MFEIILSRLMAEKASNSQIHAMRAPCGVDANGNFFTVNPKFLRGLMIFVLIFGALLAVFCFVCTALFGDLLFLVCAPVFILLMIFPALAVLRYKDTLTPEGTLILRRTLTTRTVHTDELAEMARTTPPIIKPKRGKMILYAGEGKLRLNVGVLGGPSFALALSQRIGVDLRPQFDAWYRRQWTALSRF